MSADWLAPDAVVVGWLSVESDGIAFAPVVPNASRSFSLGIDQIERVSLPHAWFAAANALEVRARGREPLVFLVPDPQACVLLLDGAIAQFRARGTYR